MNLRSKTYLEAQKASSEKQLADRVTVLQERGLALAAVQRDTLVRKIRASIRRTDYRLRTIAAKEGLHAGGIQVKGEGVAAKGPSEEVSGEASKPRPTKKKAAKDG